MVGPNDRGYAICDGCAELHPVEAVFATEELMCEVCAKDLCHRCHYCRSLVPSQLAIELEELFLCSENCRRELLDEWRREQETMKFLRTVR